MTEEKFRELIGPQQASPHGLPSMSLRDYFAGQAMAGVLNVTVVDEVTTPQKFCRDVAVAAYNIADAMIASRDAS